MRYLLLLCLVSFFIYALALVILNHSATGVNLIFIQIPEMNLGLLLIMSIFLGFCIGMMVAVLLFKVLQRKLELNALKKKNTLLTTNFDKVTAELMSMKNRDGLEKTTVDDKVER